MNSLLPRIYTLLLCLTLTCPAQAARKRRSFCQRFLYYFCRPIPQPTTELRVQPLPLRAPAKKKHPIASLPWFRSHLSSAQQTILENFLAKRKEPLKTFGEVWAYTIEQKNQSIICLLLKVAAQCSLHLDEMPGSLSQAKLNAFHVALARKDNRLLKLLLDWAAAHPGLIDLNVPLPVDWMGCKAGATPGHIAIQTDNPQGLIMLLKFAAQHPKQLNLNATAPGQAWASVQAGTTLLHFSLTKVNMTYLRIVVNALHAHPQLMDVNARVPASDSHLAGATAFYIAVAANGSIADKLEALRLLDTCAGFNPVIPTRQGMTPLHKAAILGEEEVVALLVTMAPSLLNVPNPEGATPLYYACKYNHLTVAAKLLRFEANPDAVAHGYSPMGHAVWHNNLALVQLLLNKGVQNISLPDRDPERDFELASGVAAPSAFFLACYKGYTEIALKLLNHPNSDAFKWELGTTRPAEHPLPLALTRGHVALVAEVVAASCDKPDRSLLNCTNLSLDFLEKVLTQLEALPGAAEVAAIDKLAWNLLLYQDAQKRGLMDKLYSAYLLANQAADLASLHAGWTQQRTCPYYSFIEDMPKRQKALDTLQVPARLTDKIHLLPFNTPRIQAIVQRWVNWLVPASTSLYQACEQGPLALPEAMVRIVGGYLFPKVQLYGITKEWLKEGFFAGQDGQPGREDFRRLEQYGVLQLRLSV